MRIHGDFGILISAIALASLGTLPGEASELFDNAPSNCTTINCSSIVIGGTVMNRGPIANPWDGEIGANVGECLRLQVLAIINSPSPQDLEMVVSGPDGTVWRNNNGGVAACPSCPLVTIGGTPNQGWYSVHIADQLGNPVETDFTFAFGRYRPASNPNCASPTQPMLPGPGNS